MKRKGKNATKQKGFQNVVVAIDKKICRYQKGNQIPYNSFVEFGGNIFQQIKGIPMGTNCALSLAILSYIPMRLSVSKTNIQKLRSLNLLSY
jgi:hypothetical protein